MAAAMVDFSFVKRPQARLVTEIREGLEARGGRRNVDRQYNTPPPPPIFRSATPAAVPPPSAPAGTSDLPPTALGGSDLSVPPFLRRHLEGGRARERTSGEAITIVAPLPPTIGAVPPSFGLANTRAITASEMLDPNRAPLPPAPPRVPLPSGFLVHKYRIANLIGEGGFALTYIAEETKLRRKVVIKELFMPDLCDRLETNELTLRDAANSTELLEWAKFLFSEEARITFGLRHEGIVRMYEFFTTNNTAYITLELVEGAPMSKWCEGRKHKFNQAEALQIIDQLCQALKYIHRRGVLQRDIKPANILIEDPTGKPVLIDFGAAMETDNRDDTELAIVTPGFSPIEQYTPGRYDGRCDIYALSATLYWMFAGQPPPDAPSRKNGQPLPSLQERIDPEFRHSRRLLGAIERGLALDREERHGSIDEFIDDIFPKVSLRTGGYDPKPLGEKIFVSYRREDNPHFSGRLLDFLELRYGSANVFFDIESIPVGIDFWDQIKRVVSDCAVMLVLIGPRWPELREKRRRRWYQFGKVQDYVAMEIAAAAELKLPIIPVLYDGAGLPSASILPNEMKFIRNINAAILGEGKAFRAGADLLCDQIAKLRLDYQEQRRHGVVSADVAAREIGAAPTLISSSG